MRYLAIIGSPTARREAEKTFKTGPGVDCIKTFDNAYKFIEEVKRANHFLVRAIICVSDLSDAEKDSFNESVKKYGGSAKITYHQNINAVTT
ncbi:MAG TPA: hypothetical protein PKD34_01860 [Candidatus Doudnabacteria bacterium]|nr:hypothetical protein [Candidatus Doudnabacteria bacterium]